MRKALFIALIVAILFLDYAALDDITTGNEPSLTGEYLILVLSVPFLSLLFWNLIQKNK